MGGSRVHALQRPVCCITNSDDLFLGEFRHPVDAQVLENLAQGLPDHATGNLRLEAAKANRRKGSSHATLDATGSHDVPRLVLAG